MFGDNNDGGRTAAEKLAEKAKSVNMELLGLFTTSCPYNEWNRYVVAQALRDNLSVTPEGLVLRDLFPGEDIFKWTTEYERAKAQLKLFDMKMDEVLTKRRRKLTAEDRERRRKVWQPYTDWKQDEITKRQELARKVKRHPSEWKQPVNESGFETEGEKHELIYDSIHSGDSKVLLFYGVANLRQDQELYIHSMYIKRADVKTIDIQGLEMTVLKETWGVKVFQTPYLFKRGDRVHIEVLTKKGAKGNHNHLAFLGSVCEPLGQTVTG